VTNRDLHGKELVNPPLFVGESNLITTFVPSFENIADFSRGGEGSASGVNTVKYFPFRNCRLKLMPGGEATATTSSYDPES
jgi:hypothetical protein